MKNAAFTSEKPYFDSPFQMNYIELTFTLRTPDDADIISALIDCHELQGTEQQEDKLFVYFKQEDWERLKEDFFLENYSYTESILAEQNWNALWESNFQPIIINDEVGIRAHFHEPLGTQLKTEIIITPKMSFGTGHHETTQMMIEMMLTLDLKDKRVFDFGTGTGVLAIFAFMQGASHVLANDNDTWCIENASENVLRNSSEVEVVLTDIKDISDTFDVILANINLNIITLNIKKIKSMLRQSGACLLSGILIEDLPNLTEQLKNAGFIINGIRQKQKWAAIHINN